jgi:hypothetical protein
MLSSPQEEYLLSTALKNLFVNLSVGLEIAPERLHE